MSGFGSNYGLLFASLLSLLMERGGCEGLLVGAGY